MGIPIEPPSKIAGVGCGTCFDVDQTPEILFCTIGGIWYDSDFVPPFSFPPVGTFALTYQAGCIWQWSDLFWKITYEAGPAFSFIKITETFSMKGVSGADVPCHSWFSLEAFALPPVIYDFGHVLVTMTDDCPIISLSALAESVGLEPGADLLAEPFVAPAEQGVIRFARKKDATNVKILLDCS